MSMTISSQGFTLADLRGIWQAPIHIDVDDHMLQGVIRSRQTIEEVAASDRTVYGVNTGFGLLANVKIAKDELDTLQRNLVISHAVGVGNPIDTNTTRLIMALKAMSLSQGVSGIHPNTLKLLLEMINHEIYPIIPEKGSVGASGDLSPLAHLTAAMIGLSEVNYKGYVMPAMEALDLAGLKPIKLGPKEGLALLNGTQVSTALALKGLFLAENCFTAAIMTGALSIDAAKGSLAPFDERIHQARRQTGQVQVARAIRGLLKDSEIVVSHEDCDRVQDPYCLRCQPQVMGAILDTINYVADKLLIEANAATDNPLVFADEGDVLSGGNFHAEPVALVADFLGIAVTDMANMSERRLAMLIDPSLSRLPAFLVPDSGVNSGFMIAHVTAAALASENKTFAHPASVDTIPTSANQEDHVSMATFAARKLTDIAENSAAVIGIEMMAACQSIDFHQGLRTSDALFAVYEKVREDVAFLDKDRLLSPDINHMQQLVLSGQLNVFLPALCPSLK
ncbi:histidine ammonia-lyase [Marinicella litoralis]|uniref:Histidine ammonia-lyase n=1 Tax=Marinicella litoralis TaxID=644220 RepID=A0A4R6Y1A7_9GAMM|nr:histidine ammonia-lyase [Marinicella litoralis]TDR22738.1 histidine ammonia-lyase [Marinicella litoralis]